MSKCIIMALNVLCICTFIILLVIFGFRRWCIVIYILVVNLGDITMLDSNRGPLGCEARVLAACHKALMHDNSQQTEAIASDVSP